MENEKKCEILNAKELFNENKCEYKIPIYQRNFAWGQKEMEQLLEDISDFDGENDYFLGSLIVKKSEKIEKNGENRNIYEVIDGQQRLTALYLILKHLKDAQEHKKDRQEDLKINILNGSLSFESREDAFIEIQKHNSDNSNDVTGGESSSSNQGIKEGEKIIEFYFKKMEGEEEKFIEKLKKTKIVRIEVPNGTDLNLYFERMNTRGEQLEFHEIAKARLLKNIEEKDERKIAVLLWEACSNMNNYVQMNFKNEIRDKIFSEDLSDLKENITSFSKLKEIITLEISGSSDSANISSEKEKLIDILINESEEAADNSIRYEQEERFESIISFPHFILQVNKIITEKSDSFFIEEKIIEASLDEKKLLENIKDNIENPKDFIYNLLKYRVLFDKYVLKREYGTKYKDNGEWSLKKIKKYEENINKKASISYVNTYEKAENKEKLIKTLQSCLRITYTSPKSMEWISIVLKECENDEKQEKSRVLTQLENYCKNKLEESGYRKALGFEFNRIAFTYLDYLLYRDGYSYKGEEIISSFPKDGEGKDWSFQFRNSIEHFYPQNPNEKSQNEKKYWSEKLNKFGNLALITISGNSRFSNLSPESKIKEYSTIISLSLKLKVMKKITEKYGWKPEESEKHGEEMFNILEKG